MPRRAFGLVGLLLALSLSRPPPVLAMRLYNTGSGGGGGTTTVAMVIQEQDGTPTGTFDTLKVPNSTLTDHGDGSASLAPGAVSAQVAGDTNTASVSFGTYVTHSLSYTLPANFFTEGKVIAVTVMWRLNIAATAAPVLDTLIAFGANSLITVVGVAPGSSQVNTGYAVRYYVVAGTAPGPAASLYTQATGAMNAHATAATRNSLAQPTAHATDGSLQLLVKSRFATAGTGTNTISLDGLIVEVLN